MRKILIFLFALSAMAPPVVAAPDPAAPPAGAASHAQPQPPPAKSPEAPVKKAADNASPAQAPAAAPKWANAAAVVSFAVVTLAVLAIGKFTEVLRDASPTSFVESLGPADTNAAARKTYRRSFSLSQSQMMWWFWVVLSSYVYIAWTRWDVDGGLTDQALTLTGIGVGTALGAAIIDQSKKDKAGPLKDLNDAADAIRNAKPGDDLTEQYKKLNAAADRLKSINFLADILSDVDGISLHRFQSFAWTFVLGGAFLIYVFSQWGMPNFNGLELGLLGISAGTYLGLKIPEQP